MTRSVHLHIEELVLAGFPAGERHRIQDAVQRSLAEMIANGALALPERVRPRALDAAVPQSFASRDAAGVGPEIACSILGGISAALAPGPGNAQGTRS